MAGHPCPAGAPAVNPAHLHDLAPILDNRLGRVYSQWGNNGTRIGPDMVRQVRATGAPAVNPAAH